MKIAFTSCFSAVIFHDQPVWDEIAAVSPDVLVLLGDSIYIDVSGVDLATLRSMTEYAFAGHVHELYGRQARERHFQALVKRAGLKTYAIWDDHDFLWNDACGADVMANKLQRDFTYPSRGMFAAWRKALGENLANGYPAALPAWSHDTPAPGYSCVPLGDKVYLHLTDGRTWRRRKGRDAVMGMPQLQAMEDAMKAAPAGATHLVASGSVFDKHDGESWLTCLDEYKRMQELAKTYNILILSGDIHDNNLASYKLEGGRTLFEATSSGAAMRTLVAVGAEQRNWGLLTIDAGNIDIKIYKSGRLQFPGTIKRGPWTT